MPNPRHVKKYCDFFGDSLKAFRQFKEEVDGGEFPAEKNVIKTEESPYEEFLRLISQTVNATAGPVPAER